MTTKTTKTILFATLAIAALVASPMALSAQKGEVAAITRHVSEEEFRDAQIKVLDLRAEKSKLEKQSEFGGIDTAQKIAELDSQINNLMPILDKHQEQNFAKYYIEPERKAQLEAVETDLRQRVSELGIDSYAVNLNSLTKTIEVVTDNPSKNDRVSALFDKYASDIPIVLTNGDFTINDFACADQNDDCDPIVGGIEIHGEGNGACTLGLPVRTGSWPFYSYHFITAGHCIDDNDDMGQPDDTGADKIGDSTDSRYVGDCDCAMTDKTTGTTSYSAAWREPNNYLTIYEESSSRPSDGTDLTFSGITSGFEFGEVVDGSYQVTAGGINWDLIRHDMSLAGGDSGGPIGDADFSMIIGIEKGEIGGVPVATAWEEIDQDFSVDLH